MLSDRSANLLAALATALADGQSLACENLGIHPSDAAALVTIGYHPRTTVSALAPIIRITQPAAVRLVERLDKAGLVRRGHGDDRRQVLLSLTRKGTALRTRILNERRAAVDKATAPLDLGQRARLEEMMEAMLSALAANRETADRICRLCDENVCPPDTCPVECAVVGREAQHVD